MVSKVSVINFNNQYDGVNKPYYNSVPLSRNKNNDNSNIQLFTQYYPYSMPLNDTFYKTNNDNSKLFYPKYSKNNDMSIKYNDPRPGYTQKDYFQKIDSVPSIEEYRNNWTYKGLYNPVLQINPIDSKLNFSNASYFINRVSFFENTFKYTSLINLPPGYRPKEVFDLGKNPGLNTHSVHDMGITGKGVNIAILDWSLPPSKNYDKNIVSYKEGLNAKEIGEQMHGAAVTSLLVGKENGIAPDANVYYFAQNYSHSEKGMDYSDEIKSLENLIKLNKSLPDNQKIRVVSWSAPLYGGKESENLIKELNDSGVWVLSSDEFWKNFGYLSKINPMGNPDDFDNYQISHSADSTGRKLYVNSGDRTVSHYSENAEFRHDSIASASWAIPVVAGYYTLACEADPSITPEKFLKLADETAQIKQSPVNSQDIINSRGKEELMFKIYQEKNPNCLKEDFDKIQDKSIWADELYSRINAEEDKLQRPCDWIIDKAGIEALTAEGKLDENGEVIDRETEEIKIIDIKALIDKIIEEKNK